MRFNCHTHVFNLKSVFTVQTSETFLNRLAREKWPDFILAATAKIVLRALNGENLDEDQIARTLIGEISLSDKFSSYIDLLNTKIPPGFQISVQGNIDNLAVDTICTQLRKLRDAHVGQNDAAVQTPSDLIDFLALALRPTISDVTDQLFNLSGPDTAAVALMMDITAGGENDEGLFTQQLEDTSLATLAYPGRLLPFVAVNTQRSTHFTHMKAALESKGFVGVKLYPSLGYPMGSAEMDAVYAYCASNDVPLLLHCNHGGFFRTLADINFCDPAAWVPVFAKYPNLRVCFGHFGGAENLIQPQIPADSWTASIIQLMKTYPNVYADIAYHTDPMDGGDAEKNYFANLTTLFADAKIQSRLLFGSDFFLVRQRLREDNLWSYYEARFTAPQLTLLTQTNPTTFLGLPAPDGSGARPNIQRHLKWLADRCGDVQRPPAAWALTAITAAFGPSVRFLASDLGPAWSGKNQAHVATWRYFHAFQMYDSQQTKSFNDAGSILLREMMYWNKEHEAPDIFENKCRLVGRGLHDTILAAGASYQDGQTAATAIVALTSAVASGDTPLYSLGAAVAGIYRFAT